MKKLVAISPHLHLLSNFKTLIHQNHHSQSLKLSLSCSSPLLTDQTYALFLKHGRVLSLFLSTSLITHFSKSGDFSRSIRFLFDTHDPDIVCFNALLSGYAKFHHSFACFSLYSNLRRYGLRPDKYTLSSLIKSCDSVEEIIVAHLICVKFGFNVNGFLVSGLIQKYGRFGCVESAKKCFEECFEMDSVVWTAMVNAFVWNGELEKGREVFVAMTGLGLGLGLNEFSLTAIVGALREVREGAQIHGFSLKNGLLCSGSCHLSNAMLNMYARCGSRFDARKLFDEIREPDVVSWTARIGVACSGFEALEVFKFMHTNNLEVNEVTMISVLSALESHELLIPCRQVHSLCHKAGYVNITSVANVLISVYGKCNDMNDAKLVFNDFANPDFISWNSLIGGYSENGLVSSALNLFTQMRVCGLQPDQYTLASILGAIIGPTFFDIVMQMHSLMIKIGLTTDDSMISCLISSYGKCHSFDNAKRVFSTIKESNLVHLQVMASTSVTVGCPSEALECCKLAVSSWSEIDVVTLSILFKACSSLTNLGQGKALHCLGLKSGHSSDRFVETSIVDFYCKCGSTSDAHKIFVDIYTHNLGAWNAMITGYAQHGCHREVIDLFAKMSELGIKPDEITYLGVLQSCCHVGLVSEANFHLNSMFELHGVVPCLEHYASIIDLLGRVGLVKEAKLIIDQMPVSPDAQVWQSLLSACNNCGNLELGEVAGRELLKLQPENDSAYILLSNLYAKAGNWDAVRKLRKEMKEKFIYKEAGSSWTEIGGTVCQFLAEDISHPQSDQIYFCLQSLGQKMLPLLDMEEESLVCMD